MWIIAVVFGGLIVLVAFILWVPLDFVFNIDVYEKPKIRFKLYWLFGLISREIPGARKKHDKKQKDKKDRSKFRWGDIGFILKILRTKGLLRNIKKLVKGIFSCFKFRDMETDFRIGLGDPANTGLLFAIIGPVAAGIGAANISRISLLPSFEDSPALEGYSHGTARTRPIRLVPPLLRFTFSPPTARVVWALVVRKWRKKRK